MHIIIWIQIHSNLWRMIFEKKMLWIGNQAIFYLFIIFKILLLYVCEFYFFNYFFYITKKNVLNQQLSASFKIGKKKKPIFLSSKT